MDNEVVRIAVGLGLGLSQCRPHEYVHCGVAVDASGNHRLSVEGVMPDMLRLMTLSRGFLDSARVSSHLEPLDLSYLDGKRPDGAMVVL